MEEAGAKANRCGSEPHPFSNPMDRQYRGDFVKAAQVTQSCLMPTKVIERELLNSLHGAQRRNSAHQEERRGTTVSSLRT